MQAKRFQCRVKVWRDLVGCKEDRIRIIQRSVVGNEALDVLDL